MIISDSKSKESKIPENAYDVFISHASEDTLWCEKLATKLQELGLKVWFDKWALQTVGISVSAAINRGLKASRRVLVVMTPFYFDDKKDWTMAEADFATSSDPAGMRGFLIPILRETCEMPPLWRNRIFLDFRDDANFNENCRLLANALRAPEDHGQSVESSPPSTS
jgi:hypothetical protein